MEIIEESIYHKIYDNFPCIEHEVSNTIYIPLINKSNEITAYSLADLSLKNKLLEFKYHLVSKTYKITKFYAVSNMGISMHEIVINSKSPKGYVIDHINSNGLDNTEKNLHHVTQGANAQNKTKKLNTTSKYIGVSYDNNKWRSAISKNNKKTWLGTFENEIDAAKIYDVYATYYYKESHPATNGLLTETEIRDIIQNGIPEQYEKIKRDLPKNIYITNGYFYVDIVNNKIRHRKKTKTLEEANIIKSQIYNDIKNLELKILKNITRNKDELPIIYMGNGTECIVDEDHWVELNRYKWNSYIYESRPTYPAARVNGKQQLLHRYVYEKYVGEIPSDMSVDHINSECIFDVRLQNLRLANSSLQNHNRNMTKNKIDKYRGVTFRGNNFEVSISDHYYGTYNTAEEAAEKANEIYKLKYGGNASLNNVDYSKITNKFNRIPEEIITREYIIKTSKIIDIKSIIIIKKLDFKSGGPITLGKIKLANLEDHKKIIIDILYPSDQSKNAITKISTKYDRISEEIITKELIINITKIIDLQSIIMIKKLNTKNGGIINICNITLVNLEEYKLLVIGILYPSLDQTRDNNVDYQKLFTKYNIISEDIISKQYIMNINKVIDIKNIIMTKKLNAKNGGAITINKITLDNLEKYKLLIIEILYPSLDQTKKIEINDNQIEQLEIITESIKQIKNIDHESVSKSDKTSEDFITKEYIMTRNKVIDVKNIVRIKNLGASKGGSIKIDNINLKELDKYKKIIIDTLYPLC